MIAFARAEGGIAGFSFRFRSDGRPYPDERDRIAPRP